MLFERFGPDPQSSIQAPWRSLCHNKVKLLLYNINGVLLEEKEILFEKYQRDFIFNLDNYPRGIYLISVQKEDKIENFKFLKL